MLKKKYTNDGLTALIRKYGYEHKKVIRYAKRLDKISKK